MRTYVGVVAGALIGLFAQPVWAQGTDCEQARCSFQSSVSSDCPCDDPRFTNHGRYVSCVAHVVNRLSRDGSIPTNCKGKIKRCAARSTCGKVGRVTCTITSTGTCDTTTGTCTEGTSASGTCTSDADCSSTRCHVSTADLCAAAGGAAGQGSCCASCQ